MKSGSLVRVSCFVCTLLGLNVLASTFVQPAMDGWYQSLAKSALTPPPITFAIAWTLIYALMGISLWLLCETLTKASKRAAYTLFAAQLSANFLWVVAFFHWQFISVAFWGILIILPLVAATARAFYQHHRVAGYLFAPYLLWLSYATYLGWFIDANN